MRKRGRNRGEKSLGLLLPSYKKAFAMIFLMPHSRAPRSRSWKRAPALPVLLGTVNFGLAGTLKTI